MTYIVFFLSISQCGPATVWLPTFFKIPYFVFSTRNKWIQVWDNMWVSKYQLLLGRLFRVRSLGAMLLAQKQCMSDHRWMKHLSISLHLFFRRINSLICLIHRVVHLFCCHIYRMRSNLRSTATYRGTSGTAAYEIQNYAKLWYRTVWNIIDTGNFTVLVYRASLEYSKMAFSTHLCMCAAHYFSVWPRWKKCVAYFSN